MYTYGRILFIGFKYCVTVVYISWFGSPKQEGSHIYQLKLPVFLPQKDLAKIITVKTLAFNSQ